MKSADTFCEALIQAKLTSSAKWKNILSMRNEQIRFRIIAKPQRADPYEEEKADKLPLRCGGPVSRKRTAPYAEDDGGEDELEVSRPKSSKKARVEKAKNDDTATSSRPSHTGNVLTVSTPAEYVEVDTAQAFHMAQAALDQYDSQNLSEGDTAEDSKEQPPPNQMSCVAVILDVHKTAVEEYEFAYRWQKKPSRTSNTT